jgi:uncharacterized protein (TIGR03435 family)
MPGGTAGISARGGRTKFGHQEPRISAGHPNQNDAFEVASVRPIGVSATGQRGGGGGGGCAGPPPQIIGNRFSATTDLYDLITLAYGVDCLNVKVHDLLSGGPGWIKSDQFVIQAIIPEGTPSYTIKQLFSGNAPKLQMMIQTLLADRFKLALHREIRDLPVYALTISTGGPKLAPFEEGSCDPSPRSAPPRPGEKRTCIPGGGRKIPADNTRFEFTADGASIDAFTNQLSFFLSRPVINRTGMTGVFSIHLEFAIDEATPELARQVGLLGAVPGAAPSAPAGPSIFKAIQEQAGLRLESTRGPVEVLVIDHVERPTDN